ncbi:hypothetical protein ACQ858_08385 [Variovorax ureilyticus]|uniref:hypothetical protein n=1 Tax=Variovorax ureilyticus TaxID=1836198 RepID=UPI003D66E385
MAIYISRHSGASTFVTACITYVVGIWDALQAFRTAVADLVVAAVKVATEKFEQPKLRLMDRPAELVQACAYALKLAKRERPRVRDQWRMCPSI